MISSSNEGRIFLSYKCAAQSNRKQGVRTRHEISTRQVKGDLSYTVKYGRAFTP